MLVWLHWGCTGATAYRYRCYSLGVQMLVWLH